MNKSKMSPEELEAESLRLHVFRQERSKVAMRAVEEMSKHPLSAEQKRAQIERNKKIAARYEKRKSKTTRG